MSPSLCVVKSPALVCADFVTTFEYGLRPASESAFAMLSARSSAAVFGAGGADRGKMKHPCAPGSSNAAAIRLRCNERVELRNCYDGEGFSFSSMLTAMPIE